MAYHPVSNWWGMFGMIICVVFAFFWLSLWTRGRLFFGWPYFWGFPHWVGIVIFFMVMRFIFMPFRMSRWHGYGYGFTAPTRIHITDGSRCGTGSPGLR